MFFSRPAIRPDTGCPMPPKSFVEAKSIIGLLVLLGRRQEGCKGAE